MALTEEQKMESLKLLSVGLGYKAIARKIDANRDQVRGYFRTTSAKQIAFQYYGINIGGAIADNVNKASEQKFYKCKHCDEKYLRKDSDIKSTTYCSDSCKCKAKLKRTEQTKQRLIDSKKKTCEHCGNKFDLNGRAVYCNECKVTVSECVSCGKQFEHNRSAMRIHCSRKCAAQTQKRTHEEYYKNFSAIHKGSIVPMTKYVGNDYDMTVWCIECQKQTTRKAGHFINKDRPRGCTHCSRTLSVGEDRIGDWLDNNGIPYVKQYSIDTLIDKAPLRYDFAITSEQQEVVMLIEYDGRQHYEPVDNFGGIKEFERQKRNDQMKNDYAKENGLELIRISYKNKNKLEKILQNIFVYSPQHSRIF